MIFNYNNSNWEKFDSVNSGQGITFSDDGGFVRIFDENKNAALKKVMYTLDVEDKKTYKLSVPYKTNKIKHSVMAYGMISLYDTDGNCTRRLYLDRNDGKSFDKVFETHNEVKMKIELGIKSFGDVLFYRPEFRECESVDKKIVKLSAVHLIAVHGRSYEDNLKHIEEGFDKASDMGADIVCFAETINDRGTTMTNEERFETLDGKFCTLMRKKAKEKGVFAFFTFHELDPEGVRRNTAVLLDRNGDIVGKYSKSHLTISEYEKGVVPGNEYPVFDTELGKIGMLICWDAYFPECARKMTLSGAEILLVSTAGNPTHRHIARAKENGVYVVVACCSGANEGYEPTKIISPNGDVLSNTGKDGEVAFAEVDLYGEKHRNTFWLSVGASWAEPNNIYMNELRYDL